MGFDCLAFLQARHSEEEEVASEILDYSDDYDDQVGSEDWWAFQLLGKINTERRILAIHTATPPRGPAGSLSVCSEDGANWPCATIQALAINYIGHADFDPTWRTI